MNTSPPTTKTSYTSTVATGQSLPHIYPHLSTQEQDAAPVDHFHFKASQYHLVSQQTFNFSLMIKLFLLYRSFLKNEPYTLLCCKTAQSSLLNSIQEHSFQQNLRKKLKISLRHKVDISNVQCHKNVNFHNNFVSLMIADDLKSKI